MREEHLGLRDYEITLPSRLMMRVGRITNPTKTVREGPMGSYFFMRVAARRRRALATLMKKYEPMNLPPQFSVEVGLLW